MSTFTTYKLVDLFDLVGGGTPKTTESDYWNGDIPWISVVDFNGDKKFIFKTEKTITQRGLVESSTKILNKGNIIISARGTVGELGVLTKPMAFNQSCYGIKAKPITTNDYLYYLLQLKITELKNHSHGSVFSTITRNTFENISADIPDKRTQNRIAEILSSLDNKIELNRQMNQTLEEIAQAMFYEAFHLNVKDEVLISEYILFNPPVTIKKGNVVKYVEMSNLPQVGSSIMDFKDRAFNSGSKFQNFDTLFARITPCLENGKTGFVDFLNAAESAWGSTEFIVMRAKKSISPYYVYLLARDVNFRQHAIKSMVGTSGRQRVQNEMLYQYSVGKINSDKMLQFHKQAQPLFQLIKSNSDENRTLMICRDTLLPKLISGDVIPSDLKQLEQAL